MNVILFRMFSHVIIMMQKVDPGAERGAGILNKKSSIKAKDEHQSFWFLFSTCHIFFIFLCRLLQYSIQAIGHRQQRFI